MKLGCTVALLMVCGPNLLGPPPAEAGDRQVRVLLQRAGGGVYLPQPGRPYRVVSGSTTTLLNGPLQISVQPGSSGWQVGAWRDADTAATVVRRLTETLGEVAEVTQERTDSGLTRVRVVLPGSQAEARLRAAGFGDALPVSTGGGVRLTPAHGPPLLSDGEVELQPQGDWPTAIGSQRYRGLLRVRAAGRWLMVVNVVDLEAYLRGVVPAEMNPAVFPELEALKAQAVAARTYAVAHLGDHDDKGYDLCATAACQAYLGYDAEHPLTDRAVQETASLIVVYHGAPIDAMYSSTCGGHTEDAALVFADRAQPYLRGVPCAWERPMPLIGSGVDGSWQEEHAVYEELARRALSLQPGSTGPPQVLAAVAARCRGTQPNGTATDAQMFARHALAAAGLEEAAATLVAATGDLGRLLDLADLLDAGLSPPTGDWQTGWHLRAALAVLRVQGLVVCDSGEAVPRPEGVGIYPQQADRWQPLPSPVPLLLERRQRALRVRARTEVLPGSELERWRAGRELLALVVDRGHDGEADRRSAWRSWTREYSWSEVARRLRMPDLDTLQVGARSPHGRITNLEAAGSSGQRRWTGYEAKRALDLPELRFTFHRLPVTGSDDMVRFLGRGWGHGIGLCQNGSYGLARSGKTFDQILATYYPGTTVTRWP